MLNRTQTKAPTSEPQEIIDEIALLRSYAAPSVIDPENPRYRERLLRSLFKLSDALEAKIEQEVSMEAVAEGSNALTLERAT